LGDQPPVNLRGPYLAARTDRCNLSLWITTRENTLHFTDRCRHYEQRNTKIRISWIYILRYIYSVLYMSVEHETGIYNNTKDKTCCNIF